MNKPLEFDANKMPRTQHIEIIDLEDNNLNIQSTHNGKNKNEEAFRRDRDRKQKNRYSSSNAKQQDNRNCNLNENNINLSNDTILHCGPGQLEEFNPLSTGLMYPMINPHLGGNIGPGLGPNMGSGNMANNPGYMMMAGMGGPIMMDPNMLALGQFAIPPGISSVSLPPQTLPVAPDQNIVAQGSYKEIIECSSCTLYPPPTSAPPPTTRERPNGCRTVFVGGLPDNITESIISEVFERCGKIYTLRLSKKNFCHIRFFYESSVDAAISFSGYRIRIGNQTDLPNTGRLHVDFAQARDDQYDYECRQRQLQREQRHRERQRERQVSPPPILHYTEHEATSICEKLKQDETFMSAVQVFITWLERGDCSKRNVNTFYSMIQSTNSHIRRLMIEKTSCEEEMQRAKDALKQKMHAVLLQFAQIEKVFGAACHKKVWDHFTKAQRKNIEMWKTQASELRMLQMEEFVVRGEDEMDMSDGDEDNPPKKKKTEEGIDLKEENDSLRCQLEAYRNEISLLRSDLTAELDQKSKELQISQETVRNILQELSETKKKQTEDSFKIKDLESRLKSAGVRELLLKTKIADAKNRSETEDDKSSEPSEKNDMSNDDTSSIKSRLDVSQGIIEFDAKLIGLISTFLNVHPFGASTDYIWSYMHKIDSVCNPQMIETLLRKFPTVFREEITGVGAKIERKWLFNAFSHDIDDST